jgi:hypothetical protein
MIEKISSDFDLKFFIAIMIAIENVIRIDQGSILVFQTGSFFRKNHSSIYIGFDALGGFAPAAWASPGL